MRNQWNNTDMIICPSVIATNKAMVILTFSDLFVSYNAFWNYRRSSLVGFWTHWLGSLGAQKWNTTEKMNIQYKSSCHNHLVQHNYAKSKKDRKLIKGLILLIITDELKKQELTSCMTFWSCVKILGNNQGTDVPTIPNSNPSIAPMMTSDFSNIRACLI